MWNKIKSLYAPKSENNKLILLYFFISLKFKDETSIISYFQGLFDQMLGMHNKFDDDLV